MRRRSFLKSCLGAILFSVAPMWGWEGYHAPKLTPLEQFDEILKEAYIEPIREFLNSKTDLHGVMFQKS